MHSPTRNPTAPCALAAGEPRLLATARPRETRIDFFRGIGMFIIFVSHMPGNPWNLWSPSRFAFSDATEIFVFCSGMASAIAFGGVFASHGWATGAARVMYRVWQVYWAHIGVFVAIAAMMVVLNDLELNRINYVSRLNLQHFFNQTETNLVGLVTLTYVPNYFDILPMYLVILTMLPLVAALAMGARWLALALIVASWLLATFHVLALPAEPWSNRVWFFNPFAWQLVFFTGYALIRGWIPAPPINRTLVIAAAAVAIACLPFAWYRLYEAVPVLEAAHEALDPLIDKTNLGPLRYLNFLAIAYLAWAAAGEGGRRLTETGLWGRIVTVVRRVGQQSLAVFLASLVAAQLFAVFLDLTGRNLLTVALANLAGFAVLIATAYATLWLKAMPWRKPPPARVPIATD